MTIYYLYIMTHNITGLKYLGHTTRNIEKYYGSGKYWKNHLKVHGKNVKKEIICECHTKEELKKIGIYYSTLWNIVKEVDKNGKKTWANEKNEEGCGGGDYFKVNNPMKDLNLVSRRSGDNHHMKRDDLRKRQSQRVSGPNSQLFTVAAIKKKSGNNHYLSKCSPNKNPAFDHKIYEFVNLMSGKIIRMTAYDFTKLTGASRGNVSALVNKKSRPKSVKGWKLNI